MADKEFPKNDSTAIMLASIKLAEKELSGKRDKPKWLKPRDEVWLQELADGKSPKELEGATHQGARNRLFRLRKLFGAKTTEQMIGMAVKYGWVNV